MLKTHSRLNTFLVTCHSLPFTRAKQFGALILLGASLAVALPLQVLASSPKKNQSARLFDYNSKVAFDMHESSATEKDGVMIKDVDYAAYSQRHGRTKAYIVSPKGAGTFAGVVFFHWLGDVKSDRTEFLDEAVSLAKLGTVSVLIQGYFPWTEPPTEAQADRQRVIDQTIEARRALDLLLSQPGVNRHRVAYVGHDYGAMFGSIISGVDKRVKAFVFMAATGGFSDWSLKYWPATAAKGEDVYRQAFKDLEPTLYVAHAAPAAMLFQFSNDDKYISKAAAEEYSGAATEPKQIKWYDAKHDLNVEAARQDRFEWLTKQLGFAGAVSPNSSRRHN